MRHAFALALLLLLPTGAGAQVLLGQAADGVPPELSSAVITESTLTLVFDEPVSQGPLSLTSTGGALAASYLSNNNTNTLIYSTSRSVLDNETVTLSIAAGDITDLSGTPIDAITDYAVTNNSALSSGDASEAPVIQTAATQIIPTGNSFNYTPILLAGDGTIEWTATGVPTGASVSSSTGALTGTPVHGNGSVYLTATNSLGSYTINVPFAVYDHTTTVDASYISANGPLPIRWATQYERYQLAANVSADGPAFVIANNDITVDLATYDVSYCGATPITIANSSFETVDPGDANLADDWDFSGAANADRYAGSFLPNEIYDGDYSLRFNDCTATEDVVGSTITLAANTKYALAGMLYYGGPTNSSADKNNPGVVVYVSLVGTGGEPTITASYDTNFWRGMRFAYTEFTTGGSGAEYVVHAGITGHASATWPAYIDDVRVARARDAAFYIAKGSTSLYFPAEVVALTSGNGARTVITNGSITQTEVGVNSPGIMNYTQTGLVLDNVDVTINGKNSSCIFGYDMSGDYSTLLNSTFHSDNITVQSRDNYDGAVLKGLVQAEVGNCQFTGGPHVGVAVASQAAVGLGSHIHHNTFDGFATRYTNAFSIISNDTNGVASTVDNNTVTNSGTGEASAGILVQGISPAYVYDNTISIKLLQNNQEYSDWQYSGAYGMQIENGQNKELSGNDVTVYSDGAGGVGLRLTNDSGAATTDNSIHDNSFTVVTNAGTGELSAFSGININPDSGNEFVNNTFSFDELFIGTSQNFDDILLDGGELAFTGLDIGDFVFGKVLDYDPTVQAKAITNLQLQDTTFTGTGLRAAIEASSLVQYVTGNPMIYSDFYIQWTTTIHVEDSGNSPISGASVSIEDATATEVASGTTDASGNFVAVLKQQRTLGGTLTDYNDHTVTVTAAGETFTPDQAFTADATQTVTVTAQ